MTAHRWSTAPRTPDQPDDLVWEDDGERRAWIGPDEVALASRATDEEADEAFADLVRCVRDAGLLPAALDAIKQAADLLAGSESDDPSIGRALAVLDRFKDR
jgi:hypothetical protein